MNIKLLFSIYLFFCLSLSSCASKPLLKPDFSKKIEIKKSFFPELKQNGTIVDVSFFKEHPDTELQKDYVRYRKNLMINYYAYMLAAGVFGYGILADDQDLATYGFIGATSLFFIFAAQNKYGIIRLGNKHNKKIESKTALLIPGYDIENRSVLLKAHIKF